ncbi:serine/threonine protein kinase [Numidum massiliense]|uniref:serine/threonine protein kinase n=1 Tax=Numidum massiliense TaxID=1522315 RepID=UPI0006D5621F|nr:serine/threonine-protein kinase [Numidum massiliense]
MDTYDVHLQRGDVLKDRYRVLSVLGVGGMATVYLAEDRRLPQTYWALKEARTATPGAKRLVVEAQCLSTLDHPQLPLIADFFAAPDGEYSYLVQEYIAGETLLARFRAADKQLPDEEVIAYALQLCDVLHYLHTRKPEPIVYRDLKPGNVIVDRGGKARLIDFGTARTFHANKSHDTVQLGTNGFAAPEQFEKVQTDSRADLFSLGAMLYYLLSGGKYVYAGNQPLAALRRDLPQALLQCVHQLIQQQPAERIQSATEVKQQLQHVFAHLTR